MKSGPLAPDPAIDCPVTHCLSVIGGKWKPVILYCIEGGVDRFGAMGRAIPGVTKQIRSQRLGVMEFIASDTNDTPTTTQISQPATPDHPGKAQPLRATTTPARALNTRA